MKNLEIAGLFDRMADLAEFKGENTFKVNAYRNAARLMADLTRDIEELAAEGSLGSLPGIGKGLSEHIREYLASGTIKRYEELRAGVPEDLIPLMHARGLGARTLALLFKEKNIRTPEELRAALEDGSLLAVKGFGEKKIENTKKALELFTQSQLRMPLGRALPMARELVRTLKARTGIEHVEFAGSLRRCRDTIGDVDILAASARGQELVDAFTHQDPVIEVLAAGPTKGSVTVRGGFQVDLRVVDEASYGAALQYFTGSKAHNVALRSIARARGIKINEYGVFRGEERIGGEHEEDIYKALDLPWIPPELREDRGEIDAARHGTLPILVSSADIRGDLHVHSDWSDGALPMAEVASIARERGLGYILMADHSKTLKIAHGLDENRLAEQIDEIDAINETIKDFRVLKGIEVDILDDGRLDLADDVLERLDLVVASIHSGFAQTAEKLTARAVRAIEHPLVNILGHPTGRIIGARDAYALNLSEVLDAAAATGTAVEINAHMDRLDLNDVNARDALERGAMLSLGTDAHNPSEHFWMMELGVSVARRAWAPADRIINSMPWQELVAWARKKRTRPRP